jgi:hypothetical protein
MTAFAPYLAFTLVIGAAHGQATPEQRQEMAQRIMPLVREIGDPSTNHARVVQLIEYTFAELSSIMGPHWEMPEDYKAQISALLPKKRAR